MKIRINGVDADIQLEAEKTVGEVLAALDSWFTGTKYRLSGLSIDGEPANVDSLDSCFERSIDSITLLELSASPVMELFAECLTRVIEDIETFQETAFEGKSAFIAQWKQSPSACLLAEQNPDLYTCAIQTFSGEGSGAQVFRSIIAERLRELQDPQDEMGKTAPLVAEICARLEELPLDIQTGKDARAAETINAFSGITEKVFRIFNVLKAAGFPVGEIIIENMPITAYITEFSTALGELLAAYEQHDTILVGDLAEYEIAPRLRSLHAAISSALAGKP